MGHGSNARDTVKFQVCVKNAKRAQEDNFNCYFPIADTPVILPNVSEHVTSYLCDFPFTYKTELYDECLGDKDGNKTGWCLGAGNTSEEVIWHRCGSTCPSLSKYKICSIKPFNGQILKTTDNLTSAAGQTLV